MNKQELFEKVANHLIGQNKRSIDDSGKCKYRGNDGTSCSIGCLIPDDLYTPFIEGLTVFDMVYDNDNFPSFSSCGKLRHIFQRLEIFPHNFELLIFLQTCHDSYEPEQWLQELRKIAIKFKLDANFIR